MVTCVRGGFTTSCGRSGHRRKCGQDTSANGVWDLLPKDMYLDLLCEERPQDHHMDLGPAS
jgi:hypothetical protein